MLDLHNYGLEILKKLTKKEQKLKDGKNNYLAQIQYLKEQNNSIIDQIIYDVHSDDDDD